MNKYKDYENNSTQSAKNFFIAAALSTSAQSLRTYSLYKYPNEIFGVEDII